MLRVPVWGSKAFVPATRASSHNPLFLMLFNSLSFRTGSHCTRSLEQAEGWLRATLSGYVTPADALPLARPVPTTDALEWQLFDDVASAQDYQQR